MRRMMFICAAKGRKSGALFVQILATTLVSQMLHVITRSVRFIVVFPDSQGFKIIDYLRGRDGEHTAYIEDEVRNKVE